jgi:hypothetical protein
MKEKTISLRLSDSDHTWLTQNATEVSSFIRNLVEEARRKDEEKPLKVRISETQELLDEAQKYLDLVVRNPWADTPEVQGSLNRQTKTVQRLKAKLALLTQKS